MAVEVVRLVLAVASGVGARALGNTAQQRAVTGRTHRRRACGYTHTAEILVHDEYIMMAKPTR
eukprot:4099086-Prymnesium_polylepis.1